MEAVSVRRMPRRGFSVPVALLAAAALLALAAPGVAITRAQADRVAQRAVAGMKGPVVLFRLPAPLPVGTLVAEAGPGPTTARRTKVVRKGLSLVATTDVAQGRLVGRRWLYWADLAPRARFQHPSLLILVDNATGRVITRLRMTWWPVVNGRRPRFLDGPAAYASPRDRVFARGDRLPARPSNEHASPLSPVWRSPFALQPFAITGPPDLSNDCVINLGDRVDSNFSNDFEAVDQITRTLKVRKRSVDNAAGLDRAIAELKAASPPCVDVVVWISGHGYPAIGSNFPHPAGGTIPESRHAQVALAFRQQSVGGRFVTKQELFDSETMRRIMAKHRDVTFKLVVDACFSGRWTELSDVANLRIVLAASRRDQMAFGYSGPGTYNRSNQRNAVITSLSGTVENHTSNPNHAGGFTNGVALGLLKWASSETDRAATGGDLAKALAIAYADSARNDFSAVQGLTQTVIGDYTSRPEASPPPPPAPPAPAALTGSCSLSLYDPTEVSYSCSFNRSVTAFGIAVPGGRQITADLPLSGQTCSIGSVEGGTNNFYQCQQALPGGQATQGRLRTSPNPATGMGCSVYGGEGGGQLQKIGTCTGP